MVGGLLSAAAVLWALTDPDVAERWAVPLVTLTGFLLIGPYSYLAGALALDLGGRSAGATASGFIDGVGYLGSVLAGYGTARVVERFGWAGAFTALAWVVASAGAAAAVYGWLQRREMRHARAV
jgi:sugar phosphate permease